MSFVLQRSERRRIAESRPAPSTVDTLVDVEGLRVGFAPPRHKRAVEVVHGISVRIDRGECVAFVGESGSGKSVTARSLIGLAGPGATVSATRFRIGGRDARSFGEREWRGVRGRFAGLVSQDALVSLDPLRTVGNEISEVLTTHHVVPRHHVRGRVIELLHEVGIPDATARAHQYAHELSGGLRQRALIASAIAANPRLLIADEPTTALDVSVQAQVLSLLRQRLEAGTAILLISHDLAVVSGLARRVLVMKDGIVVEQGPTEQVLVDPRHPYTKRLLAAVPSASSRGTRLSGAAPAVRAGTAPTTGVPVDRNRARGGSEPGSSPFVLEACSLRKAFSRKTGDGRHEKHLAVDGVSFQVGRAEVLGIVGESGSGKSTCANLVLGLTRPDAGEVLLDGKPWSALAERARRGERLRLQFISQDPLSSFDPRYDVRDVVGEALLTSGRSRREREQRIVEVLEQVDLPASFLSRSPRSLSGGQRQRVAIARALAPDPEIIVCDEPVSALDVSVQAQVLDLLSDLRTRLGTALLFISHDLGVIHHLADRVLVLSGGRAVEEGNVDDVFFRPRHPYTKQLIAALATIEAPGEKPKIASKA